MVGGRDRRTRWPASLTESVKSRFSKEPVSRQRLTGKGIYLNVTFGIDMHMTMTEHTHTYKHVHTHIIHVRLKKKSPM